MMRGAEKRHGEPRCRLHLFTPPCLPASARFPLTFREGRRGDESEAECDGGREGENADERGVPEGSDGLYRELCDGSGSLDPSIAMNGSERGEERRQAGTSQEAKVVLGGTEG